MTAQASADRAQALIACGDGYIVARQSGLYRSEQWDTGEQNLFRRWRREALPTTSAAWDEHSGLLLAGINGGVARSADNGRTWEARLFRAPPPLVTCLALSPGLARDGCVLAGSFEDGVFRSEDCGRSWRASSHGLFDHSVLSLALSPQFAADGVVFAGTGSGIYRSDNGGKLWRDLELPAGNEAVLSLAIAEDGTVYAGCEEHGLLRSRDGGESWDLFYAAAGAVNAILLTNRQTVVAQVDDNTAKLKVDGSVIAPAYIPPGGVVDMSIDCMTLLPDGHMRLIALADGAMAVSG